MAMPKGRVTPKSQEDGQKDRHLLNEKTNSLRFYLGKVFGVCKGLSYILSSQKVWEVGSHIHLSLRRGT